MPAREDLIGIPERNIGPGRAGLAPASKRALLRRRKAQPFQQPDLLQRAILQAI